MELNSRVDVKMALDNEKQVIVSNRYSSVSAHVRKKMYARLDESRC